jgi:hypothetical protein
MNKGGAFSMVIEKALGIWLLLAAAAIGNGLLRESFLLPWLGNNAALPLSGISLAVFVFLIIYACLPIFGSQRKTYYLVIGLFWTVCTLLFEFGFGHYIAGKSWRDIAQVFNPEQGNLFSLVLLVILFSPLLAAWLRRRKFDR